MEPTIKSVLFVDFDNIFISLYDYNERAANAFAVESPTWLCSLARLHEERRDLLIRRIFMDAGAFVKSPNPGMWKPKLLNKDKDRLYFSKFQRPLVNAGFDVVPCQPMTHEQKNAADIRMVVDIVSSLDAKVIYDEYIIASGDSDFAPLLSYLKAQGRRTVVISAGPTAKAYKSLADIYLDRDSFINLIGQGGKEVLGKEPSTEEKQWPELQGQNTVKRPELQGQNAVIELPECQNKVENETLVQEEATKFIKDSSAPVNRAVLGLHLRNNFSVPDDWFGHGSLGKFLLATGLSLHMQDQYVWMPDKHAPPLPQSVRQFCQASNLPELSTDAWKKTFEKLALYGKQEEFKLSTCISWPQDRLAEEGIDVSDTAIGNIIQMARAENVQLNSSPSPSVDDIRSAVIQEAIKLAKRQPGLDVTEGNQRELQEWMGVLSGE